MTCPDIGLGLSSSSMYIALLGPFPPLMRTAFIIFVLWRIGEVDGMVEHMSVLEYGLQATAEGWESGLAGIPAHPRFWLFVRMRAESPLGGFTVG